MQPLKSIVAAALAAIAVVGLTDAQQLALTFYEHENFGGDSVTFIAPWRTTCYNIHECFNDRATSARWSSTGQFPDSDSLIFYTAINCQGGAFGGNGISSWFTEVANVGPAMNDQISSFAISANGFSTIGTFKCSRRANNETNTVVEPLSEPVPFSGI